MLYYYLCKSIPIINNMFKHFQSAIPLFRAKPKESIARRGGCCGLAYFLACAAEASDSNPNPCKKEKSWHLSFLRGNPTLRIIIFKYQVLVIICDTIGVVYDVYICIQYDSMHTSSYIIHHEMYDVRARMHTYLSICK